MRSYHKLVVLACAVMLICASFIFAGSRANQACHSTQHIWDSQVEYTNFLAHEFHATAKQKAQGLADLYTYIGSRPSC